MHRARGLKRLSDDGFCFGGSLDNGACQILDGVQFIQGDGLQKGQTKEKEQDGDEGLYAGEKDKVFFHDFSQVLSQI